ncbi:hypothetical protein ACFLUG_05025 [Chloroflexota bacterium]
MKQAWKYLILDLLDDYIDAQTQEEKFNALGDQGWELVTVIPTTGWSGQGISSKSTAYFKKEVQW